MTRLRPTRNRWCWYAAAAWTALIAGAITAQWTWIP